jgi:hypothetical protein
MNPDDILKAAPAIAKGAGALAAAIPFTAIVKRMLGPAADELAEMWRDQVRLYRYERQLKCVEKAERMAQEAGFTPQAVPPKILFPLLEGASFEEDENLHTMWAALLANAASPENADRVRPGFIAILRQMAPDEAALLNWLHDHTDAKQIFRLDVQVSALRDACVEIGFHEEHLEICLNALEASRLVEGHERLSLNRRHSEIHQPGIGSYSMTDRGREFIQACRKPKPKV